MKMSPRIMFAGLALALLAATEPAFSAVTPQGWWHYGDVSDYYFDSSGNGRRFAEGFSCAGSGNAGAGIVPLGVGGPLGTTGFISTNALYWTPLHCGAAAMWNPWDVNDITKEWNPPPTNYVIECWILPENIDSSPNSCWIFASGSGDFSQPGRPSRTGAGGVYFQWNKTAGTGGNPAIGAFVIANASQGVASDTQIGDYVDADYTKWMHVAIVNRDGTNAFYVNGVQSGASTNANTIPNGNIFAGGSPGTTPSFHGWMDELRISTFASGAFSVGDLLLRAPGPSIVFQPQSATVWNGGSAPFTVQAAFDLSVTYQWQRLGASFTNIPGETAATLYLPQVSLADSGAQFRCILTASSVSVTSSVVTLTVVPNRTDDVNFYRAAVTAQPSLAAYFPADGCLTTTLSNVVDITRNGGLEGGATYDGRTNRAFGQRAVAFLGNGDVQIPNNPAFEFSGGNGTIEALVYMNGVSSDSATIFAWAQDGGTLGYSLQASKDGLQLIYANDAPTTLTWSLPVGLVGRLAHVALVIDNMTNVTAIVDGQSLGTKTQTGFGAASGSPAWIGSIGTSLVKPFTGAIDELAVYGSALSLNTIQVHYSRFVYGTNVSSPSIVSQPGPRTVIAGTAPILKVQVGGTLPITYQWTSNGVAIPGANSFNYKVASSASSTAADYVLYATNAIGWTNSSPIHITFASAPSPYSTAVASDHPIAYWRLNEASGTTQVDSAGYHDSTYNAGVLFGAPSVIPSETDPAVNFATGQSSLPNSPDLNPAGAFTLEVWTRPNSSDSGGIILASQNRNSSRGGYSLHCNFFTAQYGIDLGAPNSGVTRYFSGTTPVGGVPVHLVFTWDGVSPQGTFYVNGVPDNTPVGGFVGNMSQFVNNTVTPLTIGKRYDGSGQWDGVVDEVAFYDYALSGARVTNHWSFSWITSSVTNNPTGVTNVEGSTITLTGGASGYPNSYQWYKDNVALDGTALNSDGTSHYPGGVTSPSLTVSQTKTTDSGAYHLLVINPVHGSQSTDAQVLITLDTNAPTVTSVIGLGTPNRSGPSPYLVKVIFNKRIDPSTGSDVSKYTLNPPVTISSVTLEDIVAAAPLGGDYRTAYLVTTGLTPGTKYALTVNGVKDQTQTGNTMPATTKYFRAPILTSGVANFDYYYLGTANGNGTVAALTSDTAHYPNAPQTNASVTAMNSGLYTGDDLNGKLGALGDNYGAVLSAWITPTQSGNYTFFLWSDDGSELYLSSNQDPANVALICSSGCCNGFTEPPAANTSDPQALVANTPYFIQALHAEGGGGDYVRVAWRLEGATNAAPSLPSIPGTFLSSFAQVPGPTLGTATLSGGNLTIPWTSYLNQGVVQESTDLVNWVNTPGNPNPIVINNVKNAGPQKFYRIAQ